MSSVVSVQPCGNDFGIRRRELCGEVVVQAGKQFFERHRAEKADGPRDAAGDDTFEVGALFNRAVRADFLREMLEEGALLRRKRRALRLLMLVERKRKRVRP